jgi:hypothetical protein
MDGDGKRFEYLYEWRPTPLLKLSSLDEDAIRSSAGLEVGNGRPARSPPAQGNALQNGWVIQLALSGRFQR